MKGPGLRHHEAWAHKLRAEQKRAFLQDGAFRSKIHHRHLLDLLPAPKTRHVPRLAQYRTAKFSRDTIPTCSTTKGPKKSQRQLGQRAVPGLTRRLFCFARRALRGTPHHGPR
jgi:hypothetical protein